MRPHTRNLVLRVLDRLPDLNHLDKVEVDVACQVEQPDRAKGGSASRPFVCLERLPRTSASNVL